MGGIPNNRRATDDFIRRLPFIPQPSLSHRGVVICGGGAYLLSAWVTIQVLRRHGCELPIELWHFKDEIEEPFLPLLREAGVELRNADRTEPIIPFHFLKGHKWAGWQLKAFALLHSRFAEILLLDADCYPVRRPDFLFDWPGYRECGAVFWPFQGFALTPPENWRVFDTELEPGEESADSGQLLINKVTCWRELLLAAFYNAHAEFTYQWLYGDKDTFPIAFKRLGRKYARMWPSCGYQMPAILQYDDSGELLFLHRVHDKFRLPGRAIATTNQVLETNVTFLDLPLEPLCREILRETAARLGALK